MFREWIACACVVALLAACGRNEGELSVTGAAPYRMQPSELAQHLDQARSAEAITGDLERCLAYPDLPGTSWPRPLVQGMCQLLPAKDASTADIQARLASGDGPKRLDVYFAGLVEEDRRDPEPVARTYKALRVFDGSDSALETAEAWLQRAPDSPYALAAMGRQLLARAWKVRGSRAIRDIPPRDVHEMEHLVGKAIPILERASRLAPALASACVDLADSGRLVGDPAVVAEGLRRCDLASLDAFEVVGARINAASPQWGGSPQQLEAALQSAQAGLERNPLLAFHLAQRYVDAARPAVNADQWDRALPILSEGIALAPHALLLHWMGLQAQVSGDQHLAYAYMSQGLRFAPSSSVLRARRARVLSALGDHQGMVRDLERAIADASSADVAYFHALLGHGLKKLGRMDESAKAYERAMQEPSSRPHAFYAWCELNVTPVLRPERAEVCTDALIREYPSDANALFLRAYVLKQTSSPTAAAAAARFRQAMNRDDPEHMRMLDSL